MKQRKTVKFLPFLVLLLSVSFLNLARADADTLIATYDYANQTNYTSIYNNHPSAGGFPSAKSQGFTLVVDGYYVTEIHVEMKRVGSPDGDITMKIEGGAYPNGTVLEASATHYHVNEIALVDTEYIFYFTQTVQLYSAETICFWLYIENGTLLDGSNRIDIGYDNSSPYYTGGALYQYTTSTWSAVGSQDMCFEVYGNVDPEVEPTPTPDPEWYDDATMAAIASYVVAILVIALPAGLLYYLTKGRIGINGLLIGLAIGSALGYLLFPSIVPIWVVFLISIGIVALLLKGRF